MIIPYKFRNIYNVIQYCKQIIYVTHSKWTCMVIKWLLHFILVGPVLYDTRMQIPMLLQTLGICRGPRGSTRFFCLCGWLTLVATWCESKRPVSDSSKETALDPWAHFPAVSSAVSPAISSATSLRSRKGSAVGLEGVDADRVIYVSSLQGCHGHLSQGILKRLAAESGHVTWRFDRGSHQAQSK